MLASERATKALYRLVQAGRPSLLLASTVLAVLSGVGLAQTEPARPAPAIDPHALITQAVNAELTANREDHTGFVYRDHDVTPDHDEVAIVVETPKGILKKKLAVGGQPLTPEQRRADDASRQEFIASPSQQEKQIKDSRHDDEQAEVFTKLLPVAFIWTIAGQRGDLVTLNFRPDPNYAPPSMETKVLSMMAGQVVVSLPQHRIATIRGALTDDVKLGFGILGRLRKGGSFNVERREVEPHHWQVTESHVHIIGHALFFKSIGDQEDEVKTDFHASTAQTLEQAEAILKESR